MDERIAERVSKEGGREVILEVNAEESGTGGRGVEIVKIKRRTERTGVLSGIWGALERTFWMWLPRHGHTKRLVSREGTDALVVSRGGGITGALADDLER